MSSDDRPADRMRVGRAGRLSGVKRKPTIADVAKAAGVSKTLVSFVINGRSDVGEATRKRVEGVIAELGFRPSRQARLLSQQRAGIVGLMMEIRAYTDALVLHYVSSLGQHLAAAGYGLLLLSGGQADPLQTVVQTVEEGLVDGLVLADVLDLDPRAKWLDERGFPYLLFVGHDAHERHYVDVDYDRAMANVVGRLVSRGHREVALLSGPAQYQFIAHREQSFRAAARSAGLRLGDRFYYRGDLTEHSGWQAGARLAAESPRPTALFGVTDTMLLGALRGLSDGGVQVPSDMEVIGFGDIPSAVAAYPRLTTVRMPVLEMGELTAKGIIARIAGEQTEPISLQAELIGRDSG